MKPESGGGVGEGVEDRKRSGMKWNGGGWCGWVPIEVGNGLARVGEWVDM